MVDSHQPPRGSALLYGLILVGLFTMVAVPTVDVVINGLQQGNVGADALQAHAVAEAALENGLYKLRQTDWAEASFFTPPDDIGLNAAIAAGVTTGHIVLNQPSTSLTIAQNDFAEIDLRNEDVLGPAGINALAITAPAIPPGNAAWVLVQWVTWNPNAGYTDSTAAQEYLFPVAALAAGGRQVIPLSGSTSDQPFWYRVKLRALYDQVPELVLTAHHDISANDAAVPLPLIEGLTVAGQVGRSEQQITAAMPRRRPLYGLFDYVIFSDSELVK